MKCQKWDFENFHLYFLYISIIIEEYLLFSFDKCGGVKPGPMRWAQEQRFINNTPEEKKS